MHIFHIENRINLPKPLDSLCGVMVIMLAATAVDRGLILGQI